MKPRIYAAIDQESEVYYTSLRRVFESIHNRQLEYNWLVSDYQVLSDKLRPYQLDDTTCFLTGEQLTEIVNDEDPQWLWGVLSGFDKWIPLKEIREYSTPYADGYSGFWELPVSIQHPLASVEIVPWDAALILMISRHKSIVDDFKAGFEKAQNLEDYLNEAVINCAVVKSEMRVGEIVSLALNREVRGIAQYPYNRYKIDGRLYEIVPVYDAPRGIAIRDQEHAQGYFTGRQVRFLWVD